MTMLSVKVRGSVPDHLTRMGGIHLLSLVLNYPKILYWPILINKTKI